MISADQCEISASCNTSTSSLFGLSGLGRLLRCVISVVRSAHVHDAGAKQTWPWPLSPTAPSIAASPARAGFTCGSVVRESVSASAWCVAYRGAAPTCWDISVCASACICAICQGCETIFHLAARHGCAVTHIIDWRTNGRYRGLMCWMCWGPLRRVQLPRPASRCHPEHARSHHIYGSDLPVAAFPPWLVALITGLDLAVAPHRLAPDLNRAVPVVARCALRLLRVVGAAVGSPLEILARAVWVLQGA